MYCISIHDIGQAIGKHVSKNASSNHKSDFLAYGAEILIGSLIKLCILFLTAAMINIILEVLVLLIVTGIIRTLSGGAHCTAYYRCLITSVLMLNALGYAVKHFYPFLMQLPLLSMMGVSMLSFLIYYCYAPQAPHNKPFESKLKETAFRRYTLISVLVISVIAGFIGTKSLMGWTIVLAILWQAFTLTSVGHSFIGLWDAILTLRKKGGAL